MYLWIINFIMKLWASPVVQAIIANLLQALRKEGTEAAEFIFEQVRLAANDPNLSNEQRFQQVLSAAKIKFSGLPEHFIRALIEASVGVVKTSLEA
jgi:hypothetical protein